MRYTAAQNNGNPVYANLIDSCQHSRLRAALASHMPYMAPPAPVILEEAPRYTVVARNNEPVISSATKAYLTVACMSVVSMLSVVVVGAVNA